jgi:hypothetical protein
MCRADPGGVYDIDVICNVTADADRLIPCGHLFTAGDQPPRRGLDVVQVNTRRFLSLSPALIKHPATGLTSRVVQGEGEE